MCKCNTTDLWKRFSGRLIFIEYLLVLFSTIWVLALDGIYGKGTASRVQAWQSGHGLNTDGYSGNKSWNKLFK
ncbi:peptidoglycan hydrolase-like protein with peptidoglycan-binding domain [Clostridium acetobutylicum]|uniref:peptidoglycan-binding domain-containing protein n=1 Tax=Clostridium acetobutylicum TaxID=1488 RepID=UPI001F4BF545|nr:peptidoglycan-binding protein [Clostridium acetobutylicum]NSA93102.1 peptidoglycan hydrolase-like protein with peptidoglycan-binding domain [Clostridium acetobutylicum]